jgi:predicted phosphate transport protein (TIGR00153 family)
MKTTNPLVKLFGKSPFGPIQEHMRTVERCGLEIVPMFEALRRGEMDGVIAHKETIFRFESEADELKDSIRSHLPSTFLMPVGRRDLLDLLTAQDAIAGAAQDVASLVALGKLRVPAAMDDHIVPFAQRVVDSVMKCRTAVDALDELVETGFRGREAESVLALVNEIDAIESETDSMGMRLVALLVESEAEMGVLSVVFWYRLIRSLGEVADNAEGAGDRLRMLLAN